MSFKNHIVLVGLPGVGKTSIGKRLSKMLDEIHVDIDKEIQKDQDMSISKLINTKGELFFRDLEKDKLSVIVDSPSALIVSSGGGVVLSGQNRRIIKNKSLGVYIKSKTSNIAKRLDVLSRPLLYNTNKKEQLDAMLKDRSNFYKEVSDIEVDITDLTVQESAKKVYQKVQNARG